jgi:hypothetical protein
MTRFTADSYRVVSGRVSTGNLRVRETKGPHLHGKDGDVTDGGKRHAAWLAAIGQGKFSFGIASVSYDADGRNSWKARALGTSCDLPVHTYRDDFLDSDWKRFHDALQQHRLAVLHDILPKYGICAG